MNEKRQVKLNELRQQALLLDEAKKEEGKLVDGLDRIQQALAAPEAEPVMVTTRRRA
jgi:hypothetical protein